MPKMCFFFLKKWMKEISANVLKFMLTSAKLQDGSTYKCEKTSKTEARAFRKLFMVFWPSGRVIDSFI